MGGSKTKTTSQQQQTATTSLPAWMTQAGQQTYQSAADYIAKNPAQPYTGQMTAPTSANQNAASAMAASTAGSTQPMYDAAAAMTTAAGNANAPSVGTAMWDAKQATKYMDPYLQKVQANTLAQMRTQDAADHSDLNDQVAAAGAYGGTRGALLESEQAKNQEQNRTDYIDQSNSDAYNTAFNDFTSDQNRQLQADTTNASLLDAMLGRKLSAGGQLATIAGGKGAANTNDISNLAGTGATDQSTQDNALQAAYQEWLRSQQAPIEQWKDLESILAGTPRDVTTSGTSSGTSTSKTSGGLLNSMLGLGQLGLSAYSTFSDRRLKRDIGLIERRPSGLGIYRYRYVWDAPDVPHQIGVMADEVAAIRPEALGPVFGGYSTVNYSMLGGL
jgi:hypothetical protein